MFAFQPQSLTNYAQLFNTRTEREPDPIIKTQTQMVRGPSLIRASQSFQTYFLSIMPHRIWGLLSKAPQLEHSDVFQSKAMPSSRNYSFLKNFKNISSSFLLFLPPFTRKKAPSPSKRDNFIRFKSQNGADGKSELHSWLTVRVGEKKI